MDVITGEARYSLSEEKLLHQHLDVKVGVTEKIEGGKVHVHVFKFKFCVVCVVCVCLGVAFFLRGGNVMLRQRLDIKADVAA